MSHQLESLAHLDVVPPPTFNYAHLQEKGVAGAVAVVVQNGEPVLLHGYGYAGMACRSSWIVLSFRNPRLSLGLCFSSTLILKRLPWV